MAYDSETPFDNIENAQDYLVLLTQAIEEAKQDASADLAIDTNSKSTRRLEAVRLVVYKLEKLEQHVKSSRRLLNDLRTLRRLLFEEREQTTTSYARSGSKRSA